MQERHDILSRTIGYLDKEQEALDTGYLLVICSFSIMIVGSLLQVLFFCLYNGKLHPFANILLDEDEVLPEGMQAFLTFDFNFSSILIISASLMIGNAESKATTESMPTDNQNKCKKSSTRDQASQTSSDQGTQTELISEFFKK